MDLFWSFHFTQVILREDHQYRQLSHTTQARAPTAVSKNGGRERRTKVLQISAKKKLKLTKITLLN